MTTRRELVEAALLRRDTDRIPCFPLVDVVYASTLSGRVMARLQLDGNTTATLGEIATSRCDGYDVDFPTDWAKAVQVVGPSVSLKGNISPLLFLRENVDRLAAACEATRQAARGLKGFIMSTGCLVPRDSVPEALWIMARACS